MKLSLMRQLSNSVGMFRILLKHMFYFFTTAEEQLVKEHFQNNFLQETVEGTPTK
jgi:hypothetical protein